MCNSLRSNSIISFYLNHALNKDMKSPRKRDFGLEERSKFCGQNFGDDLSKLNRHAPYVK